ncbi:MAG: ArdC family protein [Coriobacteriales bacterium]|nr:ArdC family protein [Coriobacteriales bacterium]
MGKRFKTEEQRKAELDEAMERLDEGVREVFESGKWERYLEVMSRFHRYSANNSLLIAMQMPMATAVASYTDWKRKFGHQVRKGERGIRILAPVRYRKKVEDEDGDEAVVERLAGFRLVSTFGVSQTDGEPLPQIAELLDGSVARYEQVMGAIEAASPVPAGFEEMPEVVNGFFSRAERRIAIRPGMSQAQTVKTAIHELARSRMHDFDGVTPTEDLPDRGTREGRSSRWRSWRPAARKRTGSSRTSTRRSARRLPKPRRPPGAHSVFEGPACRRLAASPENGAAGTHVPKARGSPASRPRRARSSPRARQGFGV